MTRQLIIWLTCLVTVFWVVAASLGVIVAVDELTEALDRSLKESAERLAPALESQIGDFGAGDTIVIPQTARSDRGNFLVYQVRDVAGVVVLRSDDAPAEPFEAPLKPGFWDNAAYRYYTVSIGGNGDFYLQAADQLEARDDTLRESGNSLFLPLMALIPMMIGTITLLVKRSLTPVRRLSAEIERKDSGNMEALDVSILPRELKQIGVSVNQLLSRLEAALEAEREFTSNSAHELRTPIAGALAQAHLLASELPQGPSQHRAEQIRRSIAKLGQIAEKLLQLSRADSGLGLEHSHTDLAPVLELVLDEVVRSNQGRQFVVVKAKDADLVGPYSVDAFAIAFRNLLENAVVHGNPDEPVEVRVEPGGILRIINGSKVIPARDLAVLRQRFKRGETTAAGSGLGLSIAAKLLGQMNADLTLQSPATQRCDGFEAVIHLTRPPERS